MSEERYREALEEVKRTLEEGQPAIVCTVWSATSPAETLLDYVCRALDAPKIEAALAAGPPPSQHREPIEADREENWSNALETAHQMLRHHAGSHICPSGKTGAVVPYTLAKALLAAALYHRLAFSTPAASDAEGEA